MSREKKSCLIKTHLSSRYSNGMCAAVAERFGKLSVSSPEVTGQFASGSVSAKKEVMAAALDRVGLCDKQPSQRFSNCPLLLVRFLLKKMNRKKRNQAKIV